MQAGPFRDTPASRCVFYRRIAGLAAGVDPHTGRITVRAGSVWGLGMPAHCGYQVREELRRHQHAIGPIVSYPRSRTWTFLVRPDLPESPALFAQLYRAGVAAYCHGQVIALPSPTDRPPAMRHWVELPQDGFRPSAAVVITAISRCLPARAIDLSLLGVAVGNCAQARGAR
ncbi:DNA-directed RNA polymerase subunit beta [Nocardia sp. NBC_01730]|uniref:DNA-directed RNA polymerase subunit beta n=1 Tax=Nocardia sp. NBC_01730 TaxID=2975998 RepID=UPI002E0D2299|nr:DNA-directed RNA polymerase subunit beta [Nocardia sp. NBC_01730]